MSNTGQKPSFNAINQPLVDPQTGRLNYTWLQILRLWMQQLAGGFDSNGNLVGNIDPSAEIVGRNAAIGDILQHISADGVVSPSGMTSATSTDQGAVILPAGATGNTLGTAAMQPIGAFDLAGAAAAAQSGAETYATSAANTAQSNATAAANAAIAAAFAPGITDTIVTAALTVGGTQGSMTFQNGLLTAQTPAT